jgi:eukaryotic-like serine/threonine-protein kinase
VGDLLFIGSCSGNFYALDKNNGQLRWSYNIKQDGDQSSFHDDPLIADDLAVIGTDAGQQGHIYAFEQATGKVRWKYLVDTGDLKDFGVASDIVRKGDSIYAVAKGDQLLCLDLSTGGVRWHFASGFDGQHTAWENSPAVDADTILFGGHDGVVYSLDEHSGEPLWKTDLHTAVLTTPALVGSTIYVGTSDRFYCLRSNDGKVTDSFPIPVKPWRNTTVSGGHLLVMSSDFFYEGVPSEILSLDLASHAVQLLVRPSNESVDWGTVRPYIWHGDVLVSDTGHLYAYKESDGSLAWSHDFPGQVIRGIGITPDLLYLGTMQGMVYAFSPESRFVTDLNGRPR